MSNFILTVKINNNKVNKPLLQFKKIQNAVYTIKVFNVKSKKYKKRVTKVHINTHIQR